ncbi:hypothetical protein J6590_064300 [Homalodisca vitripennis]|nr:hypothetical protein J6590_064300 [Homalodisca vitripennis]
MSGRAFLCSVTIQRGHSRSFLKRLFHLAGYGQLRSRVVGISPSGDGAAKPVAGWEGRLDLTRPVLNRGDDDIRSFFRCRFSHS